LFKIFARAGVQAHRQHAQRQAKHSQIVFHFVPPKELLKSVWFFRTSMPSVTPVRSATRCVEPAALGFIPQFSWWTIGIK
jgi:hypothetical protein